MLLSSKLRGAISGVCVGCDLHQSHDCPHSGCALLEEDKVVADPDTVTEHPDTVVVDVSQTSVVVVTSPLVTDEGRQVVKPASRVEVSEQDDCELVEDDVGPEELCEVCEAVSEVTEDVGLSSLSSSS